MKYTYSIKMLKILYKSNLQAVIFGAFIEE